MSAWAYRKCKICGTNVHINFVCGKGCKGDPWGVIDQFENNLLGWRNKREEILNELKEVDDNISQYEEKIRKLRECVKYE